MRKEYDFSKGKRGAAIPSTGKTRITIMLDDDVLAAFRAQAEAQGVGYQTMINAALRRVIERRARGDASDEEVVTVAKLREILREEFRAA